MSPKACLRRGAICSISILPFLRTSKFSHFSSNLILIHSSNFSPVSLREDLAYSLAAVVAPFLSIQYWLFLFLQQAQSQPHYLSALSSFSLANPLVMSNLIRASSPTLENLSGISEACTTSARANIIFVILYCILCAVVASNHTTLVCRGFRTKLDNHVPSHENIILLKITTSP